MHFKKKIIIDLFIYLSYSGEETVLILNIGCNKTIFNGFIRKAYISFQVTTCNIKKTYKTRC